METKTQEKVTAIVKKEENKAITIQKGTSLFFDIARFEHAQRVAKVFAESSMVPEQFQKNIANCVIALNLSERMQTDPFMLMQNMYVVHGRPGIEAKLAIGLINQSDRFSELEYEMNGNPRDDNFGCRAYATKLSTGKVLYGPKVDITMAKAEGWYGKPGSKWKTMPELMLQYRAAMFFARTYCPDVLLGMSTRDELQDIIDITPPSDAKYQKQLDFKPETFDTTIPKGTDQQQLDEFLERCANQFNRSINDVKAEAAESPDEFWKAFFDWQKQQKKAEPQHEEKTVNVTPTPSHFISQFEKLNKEPLEEYEKTHREEIKTWPQRAQDTFAEKWEKKMHQSYEAFLRRLDLINGKEPFESKKEETSSENSCLSLGSVVCPDDGEHKPLAYCQNAHGKDKPCERYEHRDCFARWPE